MTLCAKLSASQEQLGAQQLGAQRLGEQQLGAQRLGEQRLGAAAARCAAARCRSGSVRSRSVPQRLGAQRLRRRVCGEGYASPERLTVALGLCPSFGLRPKNIGAKPVVFWKLKRRRELGTRSEKEMGEMGLIMIKVRPDYTHADSLAKENS
jgi:hypothetical protein